MKGKQKIDRISQKVLFHRYEKNPIITVNDIAYPANSVFNPGAVKVGTESVLLMRVEDLKGFSHFTVARSKDGFVNWQVEDKPTLLPDPENHPEEIWGIEDPRITFLEEIGKWGITYTAFSERGPLVSLALTSDFKSFIRQGPIMPPEDKDAALFPVRFGGRWALIHRPMPSTAEFQPHIWISFSPDLKHWGDHNILIPARRGGWWDSKKVGIGPPPIRTEDGWLLLYHGVRETAAGDIYRLGLALLDLEDPTRVIYRSDEWVFGPSESYEREGDVAYVVFPCGWIEENDELRLYYGASDMCISVATSKISRLLEWLKGTHTPMN